MAREIFSASAASSSVSPAKFIINQRQQILRLCLTRFDGIQNDRDAGHDVNTRTQYVTIYVRQILQKQTPAASSESAETSDTRPCVNSRADPRR